jgi:predicted GTPase
MKICEFTDNASILLARIESNNEGDEIISRILLERPLTLVAIGNTGCGKSALCNAIIGD